MFATLWRCGGSRRRRSSTPARRRAGSQECRPTIEHLEDRCLMSTSPIVEYTIPANPNRPSPQQLIPGLPGDTGLYFADPGNNRVSHITAQGIIDQNFALTTPNSGPSYLTLGPDHNLWVSENGANQIARINPGTGQVTEFRLNGPASEPEQILTGPGNLLWFVYESFSTAYPNAICSMDTAGNVRSTLNIPGIFTTPGALTVGPDNNLWFTMPNKNEVARMTPAGNFLPFLTGISAGANPTGITAGPDGNLWFTEPGVAQVARITPAGTVTEFYQGILRGSQPTLITTGPDGNLWFTEPNYSTYQVELGMISPAGGVVTNDVIGPMLQSSWPLEGITSGADGNVWFADNQSAAIGKMQLAATPAPASHVLPLPATSPASFTVGWTGSDPGGPGIAGYTLYVSDNGGPFTVWLSNTTQTSATFTGIPGHTYSFYSVAVDAAGKVQPTPGGAQASTQVVGQSPPPPPPAKLDFVALGLSTSIEYYTNFVTTAYETYLHRAPDAPGLNGWVQGMRAGMVTDEQLEAFFIGSAEYIARKGAGPGNWAPWVTSMYQDLLGRAPSAAEVQEWVAGLNMGISTTYVAHGFAASAERQTDRVTAIYEKFLGRAPLPAEVAQWVNAFEAGLATDEYIIAGFVGSAEYFQDHGGDATDWVKAAFEAVLGRAPSPQEEQLWLTYLESF